MSAIPKDVMAYDVERGLAKALATRVEAIRVDCQADEFAFRIGTRWRLVVDGHQLGRLWDDTSNLAVLRDTFDELKAECLGFMSWERR